MEFNHGSLFSGIGGFDLAAEWMGWENVFHCEINEFGQKILKHYWPKSISYHDIKKTDFTIHRGTIDVLTGGFPCQPYSQAGKRLGKEDERHLWPEMLRAIREIQPSYVVGENVRGLTNWNGGMVFDEVQSDLEAEGYEILPFLLPACAVNAPHRRDRVWFIANRSVDRCNSKHKETGAIISNQIGNGEISEQGGEIEQCRLGESVIANAKSIRQKSARDSRERRTRLENKGIIVTDTDSNKRCEGRLHSKKHKSAERYIGSFYSWQDGDYWQNFPTQSPICGRNDGLPTELDGITFPKWRNKSIEGYGNAVVPWLVLQIFKSIELYEKANQKNISA